MKKFVVSFVGVSLLTIGVATAQDKYPVVYRDPGEAPSPGTTLAERNKATLELHTVSAQPRKVQKAVGSKSPAVDAKPASSSPKSEPLPMASRRSDDSKVIEAVDAASAVSKEVQASFAEQGFRPIPVPYTAQLFILHFLEDRIANDLTEFLTEKAPFLLNEPMRGEPDDVTNRINSVIKRISEISVEQRDLVRQATSGAGMSVSSKLAAAEHAVKERVFSVVKDEDREGMLKVIVRVSSSEDLKDLNAAFGAIRVQLDPGPPPAMANTAPLRPVD